MALTSSIAANLILQIVSLWCAMVNSTTTALSLMECQFALQFNQKHALKDHLERLRKIRWKGNANFNRCKSVRFAYHFLIGV